VNSYQNPTDDKRQIPPSIHKRGEFHWPISLDNLRKRRRTILGKKRRGRKGPADQQRPQFVVQAKTGLKTLLELVAESWQEGRKGGGTSEMKVKQKA